MPNDDYISGLDGTQIENALEAIHGVVTSGNNGKVLAVEDGAIVAKSASEYTDAPVLAPLSATENGDYLPPSGVDGFNSVHVAVPGATLTTKSITANGTYNASQDNADGYSSVTVDVQGGGSAVVQPLSVTQNGTYTPPSGVDGYAPVTVSVSGGGTSSNDLLFHFDDFNNSGKMAAVFYNKTGYEISNEQSKFGGTSLKISSSPNSGGAVYFEGGFTFGNHDFTFDFWFYTTSTSSAQCVVSFNYRSLGLYVNSFTNLGPNLASSSDSWSESRPVTLQQSIANGWHHWAFVRNGNYFYTFIDGVKLDTWEWPNSFAPMTRMSIGTNSIAETGWRGYIDELRLRLGTAIWTEDFTPPTEPYT